MVIQTPTLQPADYAVMTAILTVPMAIGIIIAVKDVKKNTRLEYLLGGQQMNLLPVTMSMFVTFQSAISLIGIPTEVYSFGTGILYFYLGLIICYILLYFIFVPMMYPLEVTSIYEYLHLRFQSQTVRMLSTIIGCMQTIFYLSITLFTPALVLQAAGGLPMWMSVLLVGGIGTLYTVVGGIKSVIWTDVFQTIILFIGIFAMIVKGSMAIGGFGKAWSLANEGGRIIFDDFRLDPRVRMTVWGAVLGNMISWLATAYSQATLQRIRSVKTLKDARMIYIVGLPFHICYGIILVMVGIVTYAYFSHIQCDPFKSGLVSNPNQIVPFFVLHVMNDLPGMAGLYMATLFCGSLSTLSSGINSLAANTVEDILQQPLKNVNERTATIITKIAAAFHGVLICCLGYGAQYIKGPVIQMSLSVFGAFGTPVLGMFIMGGLIPWANKYGAVAGGLVSLAFNLWITIGNQFYGGKPSVLPPAATDRCDNFTSTVVANDFNSPAHLYNISSKAEYAFVNSTLAPSESDPYGFFLYDISYVWYGVFGLLICVTVGLAVSFCTRDKNWKISLHKSKLVFSFCRRFWGLEKDHQFDDFNGCNGTIPLKSDTQETL